MSCHVHVKKTFLDETGTTVVTDERPIGNVHLHVAVQMNKKRKASTTDVTVNGLVSRMGVHMLLKSLPVWKYLPTHLTCTWSLLSTHC